MTDIPQRKGPSGPVNTTPGGGGIEPPAGQLDGTVTDPLVVGITDSNAVELDIGAINDNRLLARVGVSVVGLLLTNAFVDPAAAIDGTKISPNFGAQNIVTTGTLTLGTDSATLGNINLPYGGTIYGRTADLSTSRKLMEWGVGGINNNLGIGDGNNTSTIIDGGSFSVRIGAGVTTRYTVTGTQASWRVPDVYLSNLNASALFHFEDVTNDPVAGDFMLRGQGTTQAATAGSGVRLQGGRGGAAGFLGRVTLDLNLDNSTFYSLVQLANVVSTNRVSALNYAGNVTNTNAPASSGDLVTIVGDAASIPSANAGSGHVYYSEDGKPAWRFNSVNLRFNGTAAGANAGGGGALPATVEGYIDIQLNGTQRKIPYYAA